MVSAVDPTKPTTGTATTASVRANFLAAKNEIEELQGRVGATTGDIVFSGRDLTALGYIKANGQIVAQATYPDLYAVIGQISTIETGMITCESIGAQPSGSAKAVTCSPNGDYAAMATTTAPYVDIRKRNGIVFNQLSAPSNLPTGAGKDAAFSPDGNYLVIAHTTSPFITIYSRSGDVFTKLSDPATLPTGQANAVAWTQDGNYLAVAHEVAPFMTVYSRSGDVFTKLTDPVSPPVGAGKSIAFSPDGGVIAIGSNVSTYLNMFTLSGSTLTKIADPTTTPPSEVSKIKWSPTNATFVAICSTGYSPLIYKYEAGVTSRNPGQEQYTGLNNSSAGFSPDGDYMILGNSSNNEIYIYACKADQFLKVSSMRSGTGTNSNDICFSSDNKFVFFVAENSTYWKVQFIKYWDEATEFMVPLIFSNRTAWIKT